MSWFLAYKGTKMPLHQWHIFNLKRRILNLGTDEITFQTSLDNNVFESNETVEIYKDDTRWFQGKITRVPYEYSSEKQQRTYYVSGPYWYLEHLVFQQPWQYQHNDQALTVNRGLCILGQSESGETINAQQCLEELVRYAQTCGAPITLGEIKGLEFSFPCETVKDNTCAEIFRKILRWAPDTVVWFNYNTPTPTLHISRTQHLPSCTLPLNRLSRYNLTPRHDLQISAVELKYEHTHSDESGSWKTITTDTYPQGAKNAFNTLVVTIELEGSKTHSQEQWVKVQPLQLDNVDWWKAHFPSFASIPNDNIRITNIHRTTDLPNELVEGAIAPWMNCKAAYETITADIHYTQENNNIHQKMAVRLCTTNATSKTYNQLTYLRTGVTPPKDLAKILYESARCLRHEGLIQFKPTTLLQNFLGQTFNISGTSPECEHLNLPVQEATIVLDTYMVTLKLGAPKQLGPNDWVQLLQSNRLRQVTDDLNQRFSLKSFGQTKTYFPHLTPLLNSTSNTLVYNRLTVGNSLDKTISLDPNVLPDKTQLTLKPFDVVENGRLQKIWLLSS